MSEMLWEKFDQVLKDRGWKQHEVETALTLPVNRISKWKGKPENFPVKEAVRLAQFLGVSLEWWLDDRQSLDVLPAARPGLLTPDEWAVVGCFRGSGYTVEQATELLMHGTREPGTRKRRQP